MKFDKSRVYTVLNADELKAGDKVIVADDLVFLKALVERGSSLNTINEIYDENCQCRFAVEGYDYVYSLAYLVERAEEKKWRPYKDCDEMIKDYKKRFNADCPEHELPLIWVQDKSSKEKCFITDFYNYTTVGMSDGYYRFLSELFNQFTYLDGSPCGVEE